MPERRLQRTRAVYDESICERCGRPAREHANFREHKAEIIRQAAQNLADEIDRRAIEEFYAQSPETLP
jgi:uncharacterized membrane protein